MRDASLLTFHDAVESYLRLAAEVLNAPLKQQLNFGQYFEPINEKLRSVHPRGVEGIESMKRLNKARNKLKHDGLFANPRDIDALRAAVTNFFEDNTPIVFGVPFDLISLVLLVPYEQTRTSLEEAEKLLGAGDIVGAMQRTSNAFYQLQEEYRKKEYPYKPRRPNLYPIRPRLFADKDNADMLEVVTLVNELLKAQEETWSTVDVLALGLDVHTHRQFRNLTARIQWRAQARAENDTTEEECRFCINFVVEAAIRLEPGPAYVPLPSELASTVFLTSSEEPD
jgi:hypothetical protein